MKVLKIVSPDDSNGFIDKILAIKSFNGPLFDSSYFVLYILIDSDVDFLYRRLYEDTYLKQNKQSYYDASSNMLEMALSISDAIGYIYKATPPRLQSQIPEAIVSIASIKGLLEQLLIDDNSGILITYHSYFKNYTKLEYFETNWVHDDTAIDMIRQLYDDKNMICILDAYDCSFDEIMSNQLDTDTHDENANENCHFQLTIHCTNASQISYLANILGSKQYSLITNIKYDGEKMCVILYTSRCLKCDEIFHKAMHEIIVGTYKLL